MQDRAEHNNVGAATEVIYDKSLSFQNQSDRGSLWELPACRPYRRSAKARGLAGGSETSAWSTVPRSGKKPRPSILPDGGGEPATQPGESSGAIATVSIHIMQTPRHQNTSTQHDEIASIAAGLWEQAGRPAGRDLEFWLNAERRVLAAQQAKANSPESSPSAPKAASARAMGPVNGPSGATPSRITATNREHGPNGGNNRRAARSTQTFT